MAKKDSKKKDDETLLDKKSAEEKFDLGGDVTPKEDKKKAVI